MAETAAEKEAREKKEAEIAAAKAAGTYVESAADAEARIHQSINQDAWVDATERADWDKDTRFHPLQDKWVDSIKYKPEVKEVATECWNDCRERDRVRKMECDEVRRRVERKLKELGCPTTLIANDLPSPCGETPPTTDTAMAMGGTAQQGYYPYYPSYPYRAGY